MGILLLGGCALSDPPQRTEIVSEALPAKATPPSEWDSGGPSGDVVNDWLKTFNDPALNAIVAEAIANNPDLKRAAALVEAANQNVALVAARMKPQVGLDLGASTIWDDGNDDWYDSYGGVIGAAWEPDVWGRVRAQTSAAEYSSEMAAFDLAYARQSLAAATAKSWYLTTETLQLEALAGQSVTIHEDLLRLVQVRRDAGKVSDLDVAEAKGNLNVARAALAQAQGLAAEARRSLETLVGRYPAAELQAGKEFVAVPPPVQAGLPAALLDRRPDLRAAEMNVLAAFRTAEAADLARLPGFSLGLGGGKLNDGILSLLRLNPWMAKASVGMTVPIYTGGALTAGFEIANAEQQQAVAAYGSKVLTAYREVEDALANEAILQQRLDYSSQAEEDRAEAVRIANLKFKAGRITLLAVLQLQEMQIASQAAVIQLRSAQLTNRIDLHLALGGNFTAGPAADLAANP